MHLSPETSAGQPILIQDLQFLHLSASIWNGGLCFTVLSNAQGLRAIMSEGSAFASSSFITLSVSARSAGVYNCNAVYADSVSECFKVNGRRRIAVYVLAVCRVVLVTCHTCDAVIKDDNGRITAVVCNVNKAL